MDFTELISNSYIDYGNYVWSEITFQAKPWYQNYFWLLILLSLVVWLLEFLFPWRKNQSLIRKDNNNRSLHKIIYIINNILENKIK